MKKSPRDYLALALDFGPPILEIVRSSERRIFLDLKFHDIPNTVGKAVESAGLLGVDFLTIHTQGGIAMMKAAKTAADSLRQKSGSAPKILGVTLLTSIDSLALQKELGIRGRPRWNCMLRCRPFLSKTAATGLF
jgi:orotidine-5'-phosphate decarboxylase